MPDQAAFKPDFEIVSEPGQADSGPVISVRGELDSGTCEELLALVDSSIAANPPGLTLDLQRMTFIDSAGMRAMIMIERLLAGRGVSLRMTPAPAEVTELLQAAGIADRIQLHCAAPGPPSVDAFIERTELALPRDPHSPARARREVRETIAGRAQSEVSNIVLLTSELVTNAVVHPRRVSAEPICLRVTVYEDRVRVDVEDTGEGFDQLPSAPPTGERGRGLFLVDQFADQWGSGRVQTDAGPRFRVWFELHLGEPEAAAAG
jgi:anti-sigma B factor antagonist